MSENETRFLDTGVRVDVCESCLRPFYEPVGTAESYSLCDCETDDGDDPPSFLAPIVIDTQRSEDR